VYYIVQQSASNEKEELSWLKKKEELRKGAGAAGNMGGDAHATNTGWKPVLRNMAPPTGPFDKLRTRAGLIRGVGGIWPGASDFQLWMGGEKK
jgi:hypothetical protein